MKTKCIKAKKWSKMQFATYIFNARTHHDPSPTVILHFARQPLVFFENHKINRVVDLRRPCGMHGAAGGDMRGSEICKMWSENTDLWFGFDTPALAIRQGRRIQSLRAFRWAGKREQGRGKMENRRGKTEEGKRKSVKNYTNLRKIDENVWKYMEIIRKCMKRSWTS